MGLFDFLKGKNQSEKKAQQESRNIDTFAFPDPEVIPINKRIASMSPLACGLYPHEILLLDYAPKYHINGDEYPGFWWYKYGIKDVGKELKSLCERGYIKDGGAESAIKNAKVSELKEFLKDKGLKASGKKDELVERVLDECDNATICSSFPQSCYALTESGSLALEANQAIPYVHHHDIDRIDIWNIAALVEASSSPLYRDAIWGHFNKLNLEYAAHGQYGLARNVDLQMAYFLAEEDRYVDALNRLFEVVLWDLSGIGNGETPETFINITSKYLFPYEESIATVPPGITKLLQTYQDKAGLDDTSFKESLQKYLEKGVERLPISIFTPNEYVEIVMFERTGDKAVIAKVYDKAKKAFESKYKVSLKK